MNKFKIYYNPKLDLLAIQQNDWEVVAYEALIYAYKLGGGFSTHYVQEACVYNAEEWEFVSEL